MSVDLVKRTIAVCNLSDSEVKTSLDGIFSELKESVTSHTFLSATTPVELVKELETLEKTMDLDLVLLISASWQPSKKAIQDLIYGYEAGARVTVARRPNIHLEEKYSFLIQKLFLYIFFGAKREDPSSPVRLYDTEAFTHILNILSHYENVFPSEMYLVSAIEHFLTFNSFGVLTTGWEENKKGSDFDFDLKEMFQLNKRIKTAMRSYRAEI